MVVPFSAFDYIFKDQLIRKRNIFHLSYTYRPAESTISPLSSERDRIPPARIIHQLLLTYQFHLKNNTEITIISPWVSNYLYESDYESQLWMVFDHNKKLMAVGDAFPDRVS